MIYEVSDRVFMFYFDDLMVREKVWLRLPWSFSKSLMVFSKVSVDGEIDENGFNVCPFWLQLQGIPTL